MNTPFFYEQVMRLHAEELRRNGLQAQLAAQARPKPEPKTRRFSWPRIPRLRAAYS